MRTLTENNSSVADHQADKRWLLQHGVLPLELLVILQGPVGYRLPIVELLGLSLLEVLGCPGKVD